MKSPNFTKEGKNMDRQEIKAKIMKAVTIALPIVLVTILAVLIVVVMNMSEENSVPVFNDGGVSSTSTTQNNPNNSDTGEDNQIPNNPTDDFVDCGLSFSSNGDGTCSLEGIGDCEDSRIVVPSVSPDGDTVTEIADNAFKNCKDIKGIDIPDTVTVIGSYAFYCSGLEEITIPSSVKKIGKYALVGCKNLESIDVETGNKNYSSSSGVLYSKDGSTLITYPAGKSDSFVIIKKEVVIIEDMAFYKCTSVTKVTYHGKSSAWNSIDIGSGNEVLEEATIYFAGDGTK